MAASFYKAEAFVGYDDISNTNDITAFIARNLSVTIDPTTTPWTGYFAAAALAAAGYSIPPSYGNALSWTTNYGTITTTLSIGTVVVMAPDETGYAHVGIITGEAADGSPIVLVGDYETTIVEAPMYFNGTTPTYINPPVAADAAAIQAIAAATMNGSGLFNVAETYVGDDATIPAEATNLQDFLATYLPKATRTVATDPYGGAFTAAALSAAGFATPADPLPNPQRWADYGQPVTGPGLNIIAVFPVEPTGHRPTGIITGQTTTGAWVVLMGDYANTRQVVEIPMDLTTAFFRRPVSPNAQAAAIAAATGLSAAAASAYASNPYSSDSSSADAAAAAAAIAAASAALQALLGQSSSRQGTQLGNTDTPETNLGRQQSGPMPCGAQHADVTGTPGSYTPTTAYSPVTRMPTHEPWTGHPISNAGTINSMDGSSPSGSSGTPTGINNNGGGTGGGGAPSPTGGGGGGGGGGGTGGNGGNGGTGGGTGGNGGAGGGTGGGGNPGPLSTDGVQPLISTILQGETAKSGDSAYNTIYSGARGINRNGLDVTKMTVAQVQQLQRQMIANGSKSSAVGGLQIIQGTMNNVIRALHIDPNTTLFNKATQDKMMVYLMNQRGLQKFLAGKMSANQFEHNMSQEWASIPVGNGNPRSFYSGDGLNAARISISTFLRAAQQAKTNAANAKNGQNQGANTPNAAAAAANAANVANQQQQQAQQVKSQTSVIQQTSGKSGAQMPTVACGGSLNSTHYNPCSPSGNSTDPDAGGGPKNDGGNTPNPATDGSGSGSGGSGSGSGSSGGSGSGGPQSGSQPSGSSGTPSSGGSGAGTPSTPAPSNVDVGPVSVQGDPGYVAPSSGPATPTSGSYSVTGGPSK